MNLNRTIKGVGALIGLYLVVAYSTGFGKAISSAGDASAKVIKTLQARG